MARGDSTELPGAETLGGARLAIRLAAGDGPIRGSLRGDSGREQTFTGWLELISALERARAPRGAVPGADGRVS